MLPEVPPSAAEFVFSEQIDCVTSVLTPQQTAITNEQEHCSICGITTTFRRKENGFSLRESTCPGCGGSTRNRDLAKCLIGLVNGDCSRSLRENLHAFRDMTIFEAQASGPLHDLLVTLPRYICSEFLNGTLPGFYDKNGVRCEDLERLTFPDSFFDLVITQDVLEHVAHPETVFQEISRVLKDGGSHIFTVPVHEGRLSVTRALRESGRDVMLLPPVHHGNPLSSAGSLVYTDFGDDLALLTAPFGLETSVVSSNLWYLPQELPWIDSESAHARYQESRSSGKLLAYLRYNSLVFRSEKIAATQEKPPCQPAGELTPLCNDTMVQFRQAMELLLQENLAPKTSILAGESCFWAGDHSLAERMFSLVLEQAPDNLEALNNLGVLRHMAGDLSGASECFRRILTLSPGNDTAAMNLSISEPYSGSQSPDTRDGYLLSLEPAVCRGEEESSDDELCDGTSADNDTIQGPNDALTRFLDQALEERLSAPCSNALGELSVLLGNSDRGIRFFTKALAAAPRADYVLNNLAVTDFERGAFESAERHLFNALAVNGANVQARENLIHLYHEAPQLAVRQGPHLVHCPCCNGSFPGFIAGAPTLRPNCCCPRCGSLERHRLLWLFLRERTTFFSEKLAVLHIAPEKIFQDAFQKIPDLDYVSADLCSPLAMIKMDITDIPFEENTFDVIICSHVLEHVPDDRKAMSELHRVLKPEGWAILQVPLDMNRAETFEDLSITDPAERKRLFGQDDHVRWYGRDYPDRLEAAGFLVSIQNFATGIAAADINRFGILASEKIYQCHKTRSARSKRLIRTC